MEQTINVKLSPIRGALDNHRRVDQRSLRHEPQLVDRTDLVCTGLVHIDRSGRMDRLEDIG
jgi:hypothetical protein